VVVLIRVLLTTALLEVSGQLSRPGHINAGNKVTGTCWIGGLGGPQASKAGLDGIEMRTFFTVLTARS
jgi:hypothetical protein